MQTNSTNPATIFFALVLMTLGALFVFHAFELLFLP